MAAKNSSFPALVSNTYCSIRGHGGQIRKGKQNKNSGEKKLKETWMVSIFTIIKLKNQLGGAVAQR